jgi:hypothetical protein
LFVLFCIFSNADSDTWQNITYSRGFKILACQAEQAKHNFLSNKMVQTVMHQILFCVLDIEEIIAASMHLRVSLPRKKISKAWTNPSKMWWPALLCTSGILSTHAPRAAKLGGPMGYLAVRDLSHACLACLIG